MTNEPNKNCRGKRRDLAGVVIRNTHPKTLVVSTTRRIQHPLYKKYMNVRKKYYVHDEKKTAKVGDHILFVESRPISKLKRWRLKEVLKEKTQ
ncbi:MAG: 30S ribosomal protein S17 [Deltaproteobacteria bacterium]|nr:30S ribosomal protein S17 [Deltaproteobacteria bacterium]